MIQIITNRGRSLFFEAETVSPRDIELQKVLPPEITPVTLLQITPGTTITGFYVTQVGLAQVSCQALFMSSANSKTGLSKVHKPSWCDFRSDQAERRDRGSH